MSTVRIGVIGDFNANHALHPATSEAIRHTMAGQGADASVEWLATDQLHDFSRFAGLWCSPGSPYRSLDGALEGIRWARLHGVPFFGTCAGFQHAVLEFARNVLHIRDAMHAEYDPSAPALVIRPLACSLTGKKLPIELKAGSRAAMSYGAARAEESYYCTFGLNPEYRSSLEANGMTVSGWDDEGEARIVELEDHPFFVATLFVPQAKSTPDRPHPLITAFCESARRFGERV